MGGSHHHHDHGDPTTMSGGRLSVVVALNLIITAAEVVGGLASGSLSLISDALHNLSDGVAILIAWVAMRLRVRPQTDRHTFGLRRAEVIAAVVNAGTLVAIGVYLFVEAFHRFRNPEPIQGGLMAAVAGVGLVANVTGTLLLRPGASGNMNMRAAYLHLLTDAVSSLGVIPGGLAVALWGAIWLDPILTVLIAAYVLYESLAILRRALDVFLLAAPPELSLADVRAAIQQDPDVCGIHHVHLWEVAEGDVHFEAHVTVDDRLLSAAGAVRERLAALLHDHFEITHATIQLEAAAQACPEESLA